MNTEICVGRTPLECPYMNTSCKPDHSIQWTELNEHAPNLQNLQNWGHWIPATVIVLVINPRLALFCVWNFAVTYIQLGWYN